MQQVIPVLLKINKKLSFQDMKVTNGHYFSFPINFGLMKNVKNDLFGFLNPKGIITVILNMYGLKG